MMTNVETYNRSKAARFSVGLAAAALTLMGAASPAAAVTETVLYSFSGGNDGGKPYAGLYFKGSALYGATFSGGANGQGVVFKIPTTGGALTVLYTFTGTSDAPDRSACRYCIVLPISWGPPRTPA